MDSLLFTTEFMAMFAFVLMVYLATIALMFYKSAYLKTKSYEKSKYTYEFCLARHEIINNLFDDISSARAEYAPSERRETLEKRILEIFNEISIGVNHELLDESIVRPMFEGVFISFLKENKFFMYSTGEKLNNPYLFNEFQIITEKWEREPMKDKRFS